MVVIPPLMTPFTVAWVLTSYLAMMAPEMMTLQVLILLVATMATTLFLVALVTIPSWAMPGTTLSMAA